MYKEEIDQYIIEVVRSSSLFNPDIKLCMQNLIVISIINYHILKLNIQFIKLSYSSKKYQIY